MWVLTNKGMVSIVADLKGGFIVRGRCKQHLEALFPSGKVIETPKNDYRWRVFINQEQLTAFMVELSKSINYRNFKDSVQNNRYHTACNKIWQVMYDFQEDACTVKIA